MNTGTRFPRPARRLLPVLSLFVIALAQTSAANDGVLFSPYANGRSAYIIGDFSTSHFQLPDQLATKGDFRAFDLAGQAAIPIRGIRGIFEVSDSILINGSNSRKEITANVGIGYELGTFGELEVFADSSAGPLAGYGNGTDGAIHLTTKRVPIGSHLSAPELRLAGVYQDFPPWYIRHTVPARAVWAYGTSFTADAVGVVTEDSAFRVAEIGDEVPTRAIPPPNGTGSTYTEFDSFSVSLSATYVAFKGRGEFFNGAYTQRFSDGVTFTATESFALDPGNFGEIFGLFFRPARRGFSIGGGIYRATPKGRLRRNRFWRTEPNMSRALFNSGLLHHLAGDFAVISGIDDTGKSTIFRVNLDDFTFENIVQKGDVAPGGEIFELVQRPGLSEELVVFEAFDQGFQFLGLYGRSLATWEIMPLCPGRRHLRWPRGAHGRLPTRRRPRHDGVGGDGLFHGRLERGVSADASRFLFQGALLAKSRPGDLSPTGSGVLIGGFFINVFAVHASRLPRARPCRRTSERSGSSSARSDRR